jgi:hypothetical protein
MATERRIDRIEKILKSRGGRVREHDVLEELRRLEDKARGSEE